MENQYALMMAGFLNALTPTNLIVMLLSVTMGIIIGCMPGLSAAMGVALLLPLTFGMEPSSGLIMLGGIYCGAIFGGSISAILIHTPGTPASAATAIDGYAMTLKGFGSPEYFWLSLFGLTIIAGINSDSMILGLMSGAFGLVLSTIGMDPMEGVERFMFGQDALYNGVNITGALIGLFSLSQAFILAEKAIVKRARAAHFDDSIILTKSELKQITPTVLRSWIIGNIIGILPGAGASIACFMGYNEAKRFSKHPEEFGHGSIEGIAGSEAANNAVTGGSLIPTLTLGIPGESVTAVLMGGLIIQGLQPGPELFTKYADMTYTFFGGFVFIQFFMLAIGLVGSRLFAKIARISDAILIPSIFVLCVVGSFAINNNFFDVVVMFLFGIVGYIMRKVNMNTAAVVLALILGPLGERGLRRSLSLSGGDISVLFSTTICQVLIALSLLSLLSPLFVKLYKGSKKTK